MPQKANSVKAALLKKGFREANSKRDHSFYFFFHENKKTSVFTKISHGARDIGDPNCSRMAKQIRLSNPQFKEFVDCGLEHQTYIEILIQGKHIEQPENSG